MREIDKSDYAIGILKAIESGIDPTEDGRRVEYIINYIKDIQQENTQLKSDLQALRERIRSIEWADNMFETDKKCHVCGGYKNRSEERLKFGHLEGCWLKSELDKIGGGE